MTLYQEFKDFIVNYAVAASLLLLVFTGFSIIHENRHKATAEGWGCEAEIDYLPSVENNYFMATHIDCPINEMSDQEIMLHRMEQRQIESTGYQVGYLLAVLTFILFRLYKSKQRGYYYDRNTRRH